MSLESFGPHADFIIAAYAAAVVVISGLIAWVMLDYRAQKIALADLDARGTARRPRGSAAAANAEPA
jgi:heme exporter protein D